jgi:hypothetical protein
MVPVYYEGIRSLALVVVIIVLSAEQLQNAFEFLAALFQTTQRESDDEFAKYSEIQGNSLFVIRMALWCGYLVSWKILTQLESLDSISSASVARPRSISFNSLWTTQ